MSLRSLKHAISLYAYLFVVWGFYRLLFFQLPETVEVLFLKPILWLLPTFFLIKKIGGKTIKGKKNTLNLVPNARAKKIKDASSHL